MSLPLTGPVQTNDRAAICAIVLVVLNVEITARIEFFTDSKIVKDDLINEHIDPDYLMMQTYGLYCRI